MLPSIVYVPEFCCSSSMRAQRHDISRHAAEIVEATQFVQWESGQMPIVRGSIQPMKKKTKKKVLSPNFSWKVALFSRRQSRMLFLSSFLIYLLKWVPCPLQGSVPAAVAAIAVRHVLFFPRSLSFTLRTAL